MLHIPKPVLSLISLSHTLSLTMLHSYPLLLLTLTISIFSPHTFSISHSSNFTSPIGINYGQVADNLPSPGSVLPLFHSLGANRVKLYDTDPRVLSAFANTGIEFIVGLPDDLVPHLARDPSAASSWVRSSILPHMPDTKITAITVGNEVLTGSDTTLIRSLVPAMESVQSAITASGLDGKIMVTTAHSLAVLETSFPPSGAAFKRELTPYLSQLLCFLQKTGSPFLINAYPYFAYKADPKSVNLNYVLFEPNAGVVDSSSGLRYNNMLYAQVDAVRTAIRKVMPSNAKIEIRVSETGWPSKGDDDEAGATPENARRYNGNLMQIVSQNKGTPAAPDEPLQVYVFALFNENLKPGPASERHYGLFQPDGTPAYNLGVVLGSGVGPTGGKGNSGNPSSNGETSESPAAQIGEVSSTGYYTISGTKILRPFCLEKLCALAVILLLARH